MTVRFDTDKIRRTVLEHRQAVKELGAESAKKLQNRYSDLLAAKNVADLVFGRPHPLAGDRKGQFALDLSGGWRLVFAPVDPPFRPDCEINWARVSEVTIVYIGDYHG
jgi:proteic killer suppression protein